jgi:hypothetical protein
MFVQFLLTQETRLVYGGGHRADDQGNAGAEHEGAVGGSVGRAMTSFPAALSLAPLIKSQLK